MPESNINHWLKQMREANLSDMEIQKKLKAKGWDNKKINKVLVGAYIDKKIIKPEKQNKNQNINQKKNLGKIYRLSKALKIANSLIILALLSAIVSGLLLPDDCSVDCLVYFLPSVLLFIIADLVFIRSLIKYRLSIKRLLQTVKGWFLILPCSIHLIYTLISFLS